jgi:hypothetical protein
MTAFGLYITGYNVAEESYFFAPTLKRLQLGHLAKFDAADPEENHNLFLM